MTQLSNVPMQPKPTDAVERPLTLVERIQPILDDLMMECFKHGFHQKEMTEAEFIDYSRKNCVPLKREIIGILKQHSDWVSADERLPTENDGRVSWGVNAYKKYILVNIVSRGIAMTCRFNLTDKCFETADKVTHWQPMPKLPSEVQDD